MTNNWKTTSLLNKTISALTQNWARWLGSDKECLEDRVSVEQKKKTKQVEDDFIFHTKIIPILGRTRHNGTDACEWIPPRRSVLSPGNLETKKSPRFLDTLANFNSPLTFFSLSRSTMSIWLQSILVRVLITFSHFSNWPWIRKKWSLGKSFLIEHHVYIKFP